MRGYLNSLKSHRAGEGRRQVDRRHWIPAFAGMTSSDFFEMPKVKPAPLSSQDVYPAA